MISVTILQISNMLSTLLARPSSSRIVNNDMNPKNERESLKQHNNGSNTEILNIKYIECNFR